MRRILSFPPSYPDEDFRHLVYRYELQSPYDSYRHSRTELFGRMIDNTLYPFNLNRLQKHLNLDEEAIEEIIERHSYFPIYRPFLSDNQVDRCMRRMMYDDQQKNILINGRLKQMISTEIRYCPTCMHHDSQKYGISYIHRTHQLSFIRFCHIHGDTLITKCSSCLTPLINKTGTLMPITPHCRYGHDIVSQEKIIDPFVISLIDDILKIMNMREINLDLVHQKLLTHAGNRGYIHFKGEFIYKSNLIGDFVNFYGEENLSNVGISSQDLYTVKFMVEMFQKNKLQGHIIFNLLLMRYFGGSLKGFFEKEVSFSVPLPFGNGPWRCLNMICSNYYKPVIKECRRKVHEWVTGYFTCPHCGMIYTRRGLPKEEDETQYSIETMGHLFINTAVKYYEEGYSIEQIAELMLSNGNTIGKYLRPFRKLSPRERKNIDLEAAKKVIELGYHEAAAALTPKIDVCKMTVMEAINKLGEQATRPKIRSYNIHRYDYVMKYDRDWMETVLPPRKRMDKELNFETLDDELSELIDQVIKHCWENPPKQRISKDLIFRQLPSNIKARCQWHKNILPKTIQLLQSGTETTDQYAIRKLSNVIEWFEGSRYRTLSLRLIQSKYRMYKKLTPDILQLIEVKIDDYNKSRKD